MPDFLSFSLSDDFIEPYKTERPNWGFDIGGGNSLAELTFITKYSRVKEDGTKERWWEVCRRCTEGYYSILKDHCFGGEVEFITADGVRTFRETVGTTQRVLSQSLAKDGRSRLDGQWVEAEIKSFGEQELWEVRLSRNGVEKTVRATSGHRWISKSYYSSAPSTRKGARLTPVTTEDLVPGMILGTLQPRDNLRRSTPSRVGMMHGFVYGDGTLDGAGGSKVTLWGEKDLQLSYLFEGCPSFPKETDNGVKGMDMRGLPGFFKILPNLNESFPYLYGWLAGYLAADGCVNESGSVSLTSAVKGNLEFVRTVAAKLGIQTFGINRSDRTTQYGDGPLFVLHFARASIRPEILLIEEHKTRFINNAVSGSSSAHWRVESVSPLGVSEEVFCAVVPEYETFALEGNIWVGNCTVNKTPWNEWKAQSAARDAYARMFEFKWLPPGRGLWAMGTSIVNGEHNSAPLYNCAGLSTEKISTHSAAEATFPFVRLMEMSMNGIGVGFDTRGAGNIVLNNPSDEIETFVVEDTREAWCESLGVLLESYFFKNRKTAKFDYSKIRPEGAPLKRFGGVASGPQPLEDMHDTLRHILSGREGEAIDSKDIVDICNIAAKAAVAGGTRRSALIALGYLDDDDFINLKNPERFPERNAHDGWAWSSNNTVFADINDDLSGIIEAVGLNGEPGIFFLEFARSHGRLADGPDFKDTESVVVNPCVTGSTWVTTGDGPRKVVDLVGVPFAAVADGKEYASDSGFWLTGHKPVFELRLEGGQCLELTADHKVLARDEVGSMEWTEVQDLSIGQNVVLHDHGSLKWEGSGSDLEGYLLGALIGDGTFAHEPNKTDRAFVSVWTTDSGSDSIKAVLESAIDSLGHRSDAGWRHVCNSDAYRYGTAALTNLAATYGVVRGNKTITDQIETASSNFQIGLLRGWFDADGHVEGFSTLGGVSVRLSSIDLNGLTAAQRMLGRLGIKSVICDMKDEGAKVWPDGNEYVSKACYRLVISGTFAERYMDRIGFSCERKQRTWDDRTADMHRGFYRKPFESPVKHIVDKGVQPVFDCSVEVVHAFDANGIYVHNCGEIPLAHAEVCNLNEIFPQHHETLSDLKKTIKHAYLYSKAVTLLPTPWPETNQIVQRNRRIGCSMSGLAQFVEDRGWTTLREWMDQGYKEVRRRDKQYSEWLGVRESIRMTTVKPSGSVSIVAASTPGVHWPIASGVYIRRMRFSSFDPMVAVLVEAGYKVEPDVMSPKTTVVIEFPTTGPAMRDQTEVSIWEKAELASLAQRWWSDNMVSCTLSFSEEERDQVPALIAAKTGHLKSMSLLPPDGVYPQMPYEAIDESNPPDLSLIKKVDLELIYNEGAEAEGDRYCTTDHCELPV